MFSLFVHLVFILTLSLVIYTMFIIVHITVWCYDVGWATNEPPLVSDLAGG